METVLETELLLETILENLGPGDLKEARRVSKQWSYRATRILLAKQLLTVTHAFQNNPNDEHAQKLLGLARTMKESALFPACTFAFSNFNFKSPDLQHLFHTFGHLIRTLDISLVNGNLPGVTRRELLHSFKHVLLVYLPNLERLTLASKITLLPEPEMSEEIEETSSSGSSSNSNLLAKLKFVRVESELPVNVFEFITAAGVSLKEVDLWCDRQKEFVEVLRRANKVHLLISVTLLFKSDNMVLIEHLASAKLSLRKVKIMLNPMTLGSANICPQAVKSMARFLHACAHSLVEMTIPPLFYLQQFEVPILPRLQKLMVFSGETSCEDLAPMTFKMSRTFPRLSHVSIQHPPARVGNFWCKQMYENKFLGADYEDRAPTVNTLELYSDPPFICIQKLPSLFPNIKKLVIGQLLNLSQVLNVLWDFIPTLVSMTFGVTIRALESLQNASLNANAFTALDAALTGFSDETCAQLANNSSSEVLDAATLKKLRVQKSMVDAKSLESLSIRIIDGSTATRTSPTKAVLSKIAFQYAFQMCPNVKVELALRGRDEENVKHLLAGISPLLSCSVNIKKEENHQEIGPVTISNYAYTLTL